MSFFTVKLHSYTVEYTFLKFFYPVEFNRAKKPTLEGSAWTGRLNLSSLLLFSFSELNKALDTNEYNWWRVFIFLPQELQTRSDLSSVRNILFASPYIKRAPLSALRAETRSWYQSDPPENQTCHTDEEGASLACYQSTLFSGTSFSSQWYFPERSTNEILWEIIASSPFLCPSRLRRSLVRSRETRFAHPNRRACSQANNNSVSYALSM